MNSPNYPNFPALDRPTAPASEASHSYPPPSIAQSSIPVYGGWPALYPQPWAPATIGTDTKGDWGLENGPVHGKIDGLGAYQGGKWEEAQRAGSTVDIQNPKIWYSSVPSVALAGVNAPPAELAVPGMMLPPGNPLLPNHNIATGSGPVLFERQGRGREQPRLFPGKVQRRPQLRKKKAEDTSPSKNAKEPIDQRLYDPRNFYDQTRNWVTAPWGPETTEGRKIFSYQRDGQLAEGQAFTTEELGHYLCRGRCHIWIQQAPSQCKYRLIPDDHRCRWKDCPVAGRSISSGWLRVAFDEYTIETADGTKDPMKMAGMMHLWCFEQCFDVAEFWKLNRLDPDTREFAKEQWNPMALNRDSNRLVVSKAFDPWLQEREKEKIEYAKTKAEGGEVTSQDPARLPRPHEKSLSFALVKYHMESQTGARGRAREKRNEKRAESICKTMDKHNGDLGKYCEISRLFKEAKRQEQAAEREEKAREMATSAPVEPLVGPPVQPPNEPMLERTTATQAVKDAEEAPDSGNAAQPGAQGVTYFRAQQEPHFDLLDPATWTALDVPLDPETQFHFDNKVADFIAQQQPHCLQGHTEAVGASAEPSGGRSSKRKRGGAEDEASEERSTKTQRMDDNPAKRKREGPGEEEDEAEQGPRTKRARTDARTQEGPGEEARLQSASGNQVTGYRDTGDQQVRGQGTAYQRIQDQGAGYRHVRGQAAAQRRSQGRGRQYQGTHGQATDGQVAHGRGTEGEAGVGRLDQAESDDERDGNFGSGVAPAA
ncbi:hypothetical protein CDD83_774 [Cordyceps sp. RAO-2017]|nr:hypothetical protein CDD83_774 [Cordyceps sp. RAO-2017]